MCPNRSQVPSPDPSLTRVSFTDRIDPAAADALWRIVLGQSDPEGGGTSAEGAGPGPGTRPEEGHRSAGGNDASA